MCSNVVGVGGKGRKQARIVCFRTDAQFGALLEKLAKENNRSLSDLVRELLELSIIAISDNQIRSMLVLKKMERPLYKMYRMF